MGRDGLATRRNWAANRAEVLSEKQSGWASLEGNQVYLDLVIGGKRDQTMRLVFALFLDEVPLAAANFHALCSHKYGGLGEGGQPLTYKRSRFHRIVRGSFLQGGQLAGLGSGGDSIYGSAGFEDEPFGLRMCHNVPGILSMANRGPDTNRSQFIITTGACPFLDGSHVVIGRLVSGAVHLETLDAVPVNSNGQPVSPIEVVECGALRGWQRPPVPLPEEHSLMKLDPDAVRQEAEAQRNAVAAAVSAALTGKRKNCNRDQDAASYEATSCNASLTNAGSAPGVRSAALMSGHISSSAPEAKRQAMISGAMDPLASLIESGDDGESDGETDDA